MQSIIHNWTNIFTVTEESFLLAEARETFVLLVKTELPLGEDFNLHCGLHCIKTQYHIQQRGTVKGSKAPSSTSSSLFITSGEFSESGLGYQGACFAVQSITKARMTLKFEYALTWSELIVKDYDKLAVLCEYIQDLIALDYEILIDVGKLRNVKLLCVTMLFI
jgi:hypothetical protein